MNKIVISATELKKKTGDILNRVFYGDTIVEIKKYGEVIAEIRPKKKAKKKKTDKKTILKKFLGAIPDFPEVYKERSKLQRTVKL